MQVEVTMSRLHVHFCITFETVFAIFVAIPRAMDEVFVTSANLITHSDLCCFLLSGVGSAADIGERQLL